MDAHSREPLVASNIRISGTTWGTITNSDGLYVLSLPAGSHVIIVSYVGYKSDTSVVSVPQESRHDVMLIPAAIQLPEIIVGAEDPAYEIMRNVIARKGGWLDGLASFEGKAYARTIMRLDTAIAMIAESYSTLCWARGDSLREIITQQRQSANVPTDLPVAYVGEIVNFYEDRIHDAGFIFVGPAAHDAFSYYDYKLRNVRSIDGFPVYDIEVIPLSQLTPLYHGRISVAGETYAMMEIDLQPNEAFVLPFVTAAAIRFRQQFRLYEDKYWLPADYHLDAQLGISALVASVKVGVEKTVVMYDYSINRIIADSLRRLPRLVVDPRASVFDSTFWVETNVLPLTSEQQLAYLRIDSTHRASKQQPRSKVLSFIGFLVPWVKHIDLRFNRAEGFFLGGKVSLDTLFDLGKLYGGLGYGFSDERVKFALGTIIYPFRTKRVGFGLEFYRTLTHAPDANMYGPLEIALAALLRKEDYRDYYLAAGSRMFIMLHPYEKGTLRSSQFALAYRNEKHESIPVMTNFSLARKGRLYRENPLVTNGLLRAISLDMEIGNLFTDQGGTAELFMRGTIEHSSHSALRSDFNFTQYRASIKGKFPTLYKNRLLKPFFAFSLLGGLTRGEIHQQRMLTIESNLAGYAPFGVMHGTAVKEYSGSSFLSLTIEHNFRNLPFQALGISTWFEAILYASAGRTWLAARQNESPVQFNLTPGWYQEIGLGLSRLLQIFRIDFTWRATLPQTYLVTLRTVELF